MSFVKTLDELAKLGEVKYDYYNAEVLSIFWETKSEIVERLLPAPLEPTSTPLVYAFLANYPKLGFSTVPYSEAGLFLRSKFKGEEGNYCLSMPVTTDMAMVGGREMWGFPKKIANILFTKNNSDIDGWVERHNIRFFEVKAALTTEAADKAVLDFYDEVGINASVRTNYNFKCFPAPEGGAFDYNPRLVKTEVDIRPSSSQMVEVEVKLNSSDTDPWDEIEIVKILGAIYSITDIILRQGSVIAEADPFTFMPFAFQQYDL